MAAFAALAFVGVSCSEDEDAPIRPNSLALVNELDAQINLNKDEKDVFFVDIKTTLSADEIEVRETTGADWCDAEVVIPEEVPAAKASSNNEVSEEDAEGETPAEVQNIIKIKVTPGENFTDEDLEAEFVVEKKADAEGTDVLPISFKVVRVGQATEYTLSYVTDDFVIKEEYGTMSYISELASSFDGELEIKVTTNAARWYVNVMMEGDGFEVLNSSGRSGETLKIKIKPNLGKENITHMFMIASEEGSYMGDRFNVIRFGKPATEVSFEYNDKPISSPYAYQFKEIDRFQAKIKANGAVEFLAVKSGTMEKLENPWFFATENYRGLMVTKDPNKTGKTRKADLVVVGAGTKNELFRFQFTQLPQEEK